ncbi:MAG: tripartite tricarboxylate transporter TctB family protein, partial [Chloroflexota bacterium]
SGKLAEVPGTRPGSLLLERLTFLLLVLLGLAAGRSVLGMPKAFPTGPGLIPGIACGLLVVGGAAGLIDSCLRSPKPPAPVPWLRFVRVLVAVIVYVALLNVWSFLLASVVGAVAIYEMAQESRNIGHVRSHWRDLVSIMAAIVVIDLLFSKVLHAGLP